MDVTTRDRDRPDMHSPRNDRVPSPIRFALSHDAQAASLRRTTGSRRRLQPAILGP
jgi:hypothetical protein